MLDGEILWLLSWKAAESIVARGERYKPSFSYEFTSKQLKQRMQLPRCFHFPKLWISFRNPMNSDANRGIFFVPINQFSQALEIIHRYVNWLMEFCPVMIYDCWCLMCWYFWLTDSFTFHLNDTHKSSTQIFLLDLESPASWDERLLWESFTASVGSPPYCRGRQKVYFAFYLFSSCCIAGSLLIFNNSHTSSVITVSPSYWLMVQYGAFQLSTWHRTQRKQL